MVRRYCKGSCLRKNFWGRNTVALLLALHQGQGGATLAHSHAAHLTLRGESYLSTTSVRRDAGESPALCPPLGPGPASLVHSNPNEMQVQPPLSLVPRVKLILGIPLKDEICICARLYFLSTEHPLENGICKYCDHCKFIHSPNSILSMIYHFKEKVAR